MGRRNGRAAPGQMHSRWERRRRKVEDPDPIRRHAARRARIDRCAETGKLCFRSDRHAQKALQALQEQRDQDIAAGLRDPSEPREIRAYECPHCGFLHTTSMEKQHSADTIAA